MTSFQSRSRVFLRNVSRASAWMMRRNVGLGHWWRWTVLTSKNPDPLKRPVFDDDTAKRIFDELERRELIEPLAGVAPDSSGAQAYLMRYDIDGWDRAVSDGRSVFGTLIKMKRTWFSLLAVFILGCVLTSMENRTVGLIDSVIDSALKLLK